MTAEHVKVRVSRAALKRRQEEVAQLLAGYGLRRGPRRLSRGAHGSEEPHCRRLRFALEKLGPAFSSFGIYMSTRADLLPAEDASELAAIRDLAEPLPPFAVRDLFTREVGCQPEEVFRSFEEEPFSSRLLFQSHRARLPDGQAVAVKLLRPEAEECLLLDLELLPLLKVALAGRIGNDPALDGAINDFRLVLKQKADLVREADALEGLALDNGGSALLRVPRVHTALCTRRVLTVERLTGVGLNDLLSSNDGEGVRDSGGFVLGGEAARRGLAHRLSVAWLRQVVLGSFFPVELSPDDVAVLPNGQVVLTGGFFASLPPESRVSLWGYLIAVANEDPGRSCSHLLQELRRDESPGHEDVLRQRLKQVVPFRDGSWGDGDGLAERLLLHWRLMGECGHLPGAALTSFYRGLYLSGEIARRLVPGYDALREALQEVRLIEGVERLRAMIDPEQFGEQMGRYAAVVTDLPQRLDEVLTLAAAGDPRLSLRVNETAEQRRRKNSSAKVTALLLALAAVALLTQRFADSLAGAWVERFGAVAFILVGVLLLRAASRA